MTEEIKQIPKGVSVLIVILISLIISFCVTFFSYFYLFPILEKNNYVRVPDIRNIPLSEATKKLEPLGLRYEVLEEIPSEVVPTGCIIQQYPVAKTIVKKNTEVIVVLSKGVPLVRIPDLKGKPLEEAKKIINELGLTINEIKEVEKEDVEKGLVVETEPPTTMEVKKGSFVNIVVSKGSPPKKEIKNVIVPNVLNMSLIEAKKVLESKGLKLGNIKKVCDEDKDFDIVISQSPKPGTSVTRGSKVNIVYNSEEE